MRIALVLLFFALCGSLGCSSQDKHMISNTHRIPIDGHRWYSLNYGVKGFDQLFDTITDQQINSGYGKLLKNFDSWYPIMTGEYMEIDSMAIYDNGGGNKDHPFTIYAITNDSWQRIPFAIYTGGYYKQWIGPDPAKPGVFALPHPLKNIRYVVINSWGELPAEVALFGTYAPPAKINLPEKKYYPLKNYFGVNAFEWDFEDGHHPDVIDTPRANAIARFTGIRHYMDWKQMEFTEGHFTFNPVHNGSWNYDTIYQWCSDHHIEVLPCLKTIPAWIENTYPQDQRDNENVPCRYGSDLAEPQSYIEQARVAFQFAARYGSNKNISPRLVLVDSFPRWPNDQVNQVKTGLGLVKYIECENERDKWWKGRKAYLTGREYAANLSAFYDGHKNKMGSGVGVKNADPAMKVVMAGLANPTTDYIMGMIDWCRQYRGYKPGGSLDLPWDVMNYHYYANDGDYDHEQTKGVAPELSDADATAEAFMQFSATQAGNMPVWVTETGYDLDAQSPQRAEAGNNETAQQVQADWTLRTALLYARHGIQKLFFFQLYDDNPKSGGKFATSGLVNADHTNRPAEDYLEQTNKLFGNFTYVKTISKSPMVDEYTSGDTTMYMVVCIDGKQCSYSLDLGNANTAYLYKPHVGTADMQMQKIPIVNSKAMIMGTSTPVFVTNIKLSN